MQGNRAVWGGNKVVQGNGAMWGGNKVVQGNGAVWGGKQDCAGRRAGNNHLLSVGLDMNCC